MKTVLLGDVENPHRTMLEAGLAQHGCIVLTARSFDEAINLTRWNRFDMIAVDIAIWPLGTATVDELCVHHAVRPLLALTCTVRERRWLGVGAPSGFDVRLVKVVDPCSLARRLRERSRRPTSPRFG
jgi:DNA-binding response OmpR family regulator